MPDNDPSLFFARDEYVIIILLEGIGIIDSHMKILK